MNTDDLTFQDLLDLRAVANAAAASAEKATDTERKYIARGLRLMGSTLQAEAVEKMRKQK